jgi:hypothetical protein
VRAQAAELSVACFDLEYLKAFHRDRKAIKKWGTSPVHLFLQSCAFSLHPECIMPNLSLLLCGSAPVLEPPRSAAPSAASRKSPGSPDLSDEQATQGLAR